MKALVRCAILVCIVAVSGPALAQQAKSAARSPQDLLRSVLEIAKSDDLTNADLLGKKLGLRFVAQPQRDYRRPGRRVTVVPMRLQSHDKGVFDPNRGPLFYDIYDLSGKSHKNVSFAISLATRKMCITVNDFLAVFGSGARRFEATDNGGFGYNYTIEQKNEIKVGGFFGHEKCMEDLTMSQNMDRAWD